KSEQQLAVAASSLRNCRHLAHQSCEHTCGTRFDLGESVLDSAVPVQPMRVTLISQACVPNHGITADVEDMNSPRRAGERLQIKPRNIMVPILFGHGSPWLVRPTFGKLLLPRFNIAKPPLWYISHVET